MASETRRAFPVGVWLLCLAALAALAIAAFNTFNSGNGIAYTPGAYLVLASTALLLVGALVLAFGARLPRWIVVVFAVLTLLDILGTAFAAWLLEAGLLLALTGAAGIGWLIHVVLDPVRDRRPRAPAEQEA